MFDLQRAVIARDYLSSFDKLLVTATFPTKTSSKTDTLFNHCAIINIVELIKAFSNSTLFTSFQITRVQSGFLYKSGILFYLLSLIRDCDWAGVFLTTLVVANFMSYFQRVASDRIRFLNILLNMLILDTYSEYKDDLSLFLLRVYKKMAVYN